MMATDVNFQKILDKLQEIHDEFPDLKFGYVVQSGLDKGKLWKNCDLHDHSSKHLLIAINEFHRHIQQNKGRRGKAFKTVKQELFMKIRAVKGISVQNAKKIIKDLDSEETLLNVLYPEEDPIDEATKATLRKVFKR